jgi:sugar lactone lactonase YvrE
MSAVRVADIHCWIGESLVWHADERALYWLDIPERRLYRYAPNTGRNAITYRRDGASGGLIAQRDGTLPPLLRGGRIVY